jgi:ribosomal-protein-alanine N-acetyltransferase
MWNVVPESLSRRRQGRVAGTVPVVPVIERLRLDHAAAVLVFERENRAYFAASVSDRGDDYFTDFRQRHRALLAEQATGTCHFHVVVGDGGEVLGRVNLVDVADGSAELGFRIAEKAAGQGLATAAVRQLCAMAARDYGLGSLRASAATDNLGSRAVLGHVGFTPTGEEVLLAGRPGLRYLLRLADLAPIDVR